MIPFGVSKRIEIDATKKYLGKQHCELRMEAYIMGATAEAALAQRYLTELTALYEVIKRSQKCFEEEEKMFNVLSDVNYQRAFDLKAQREPGKMERER